MFPKPYSEFWNIITQTSKQYQWYLWNYTPTRLWKLWHTCMHWVFAIVTSNLKISSLTLSHMFSKFAILDQPRSSRRGRSMSATFAPGIIGHQSLFSELPLTITALMYGQWDVLLLSFCLASLSSREILVLINLSKLLKSSEHPPEIKSSQWTQTTQNSNSHTSKQTNGKPFSKTVAVNHPNKTWS